MMQQQVAVGTCRCGTNVRRELDTGPFAAHLNALPFRCAACEAADDAEAARGEVEERERRSREDLVTRLGRSDLPSALRAVEIDRLDRTGAAAAIDAAKRWARDGGGLLLTGPFGVGKTTIAAGALRLALRRRSGRWTSAPLLMAQLSSFGTTHRDRAIDVLAGRGALVLDDVDKTRPTEYGAEQIFVAIDGAVSSDRALLITTNLSVGELARRWPAPYGEAIASRLAGYCLVVEVTGPDRRLFPDPPARDSA